MEIRFVFGELAYSRPRAFRGRAHDSEDFLQLVFVCGAGEEWATRVHFGHDAAGGPDIDTGVIGAGAEEDVWGAVPERYHFVGEGVDGNSEGASETEVREFELAFVVDEEVLGFEVAVKDAVVVAEGYTLQELVHE